MENDKQNNFLNQSKTNLNPHIEELVQKLEKAGMKVERTQDEIRAYWPEDEREDR